MDVAASGASVWAGCIVYLECTQVHNIYRMHPGQPMRLVQSIRANRRARCVLVRANRRHLVLLAHHPPFSLALSPTFSVVGCSTSIHRAAAIQSPLDFAFATWIPSGGSSSPRLPLAAPVSSSRNHRSAAIPRALRFPIRPDSVRAALPLHLDSVCAVTIPSGAQAGLVTRS
jgi:hypothetical protein